MSAVQWTKENTLTVIAMVNRLADELTAERERRIAAEEVVDAAIRIDYNDSYEGAKAARAYRSRFPHARSE